MKKISRIALWLSLVLVWIGYMPKTVHADEAFKVPALTGRVNDEAGMLSPEAKEVLERKLAEYERATQGIQIAVITTNDFQGLEVEDFSIKVASAWALGQKGVDNGVLITFNPVARKIRIEVGSGLEGILTDLQSGRIIQEVSIPNMKKSLDAASDTERQSYVDAAVVQTAESVMNTIGSKPYPEMIRLYQAEQARQAAKTRSVLLFFAVGGVAVLIIAWIAYLVSSHNERKRARVRRLALIQGLESQLTDLTATFGIVREKESAYVTEARLRQYDGDMIDVTTGIEQALPGLQTLVVKNVNEYEWEKAYYAALAVLVPLRSAIKNLTEAADTISGIGKKAEMVQEALRLAQEAVSKPKVEEKRRGELVVQRQMFEGVISAIPRMTDAKAFDYLSAAATLAAIIVALKHIRENAVSDVTPKRKESDSSSSRRHSISSPSSFSSGSFRGGGLSGGGGGFRGGGASGGY